MLIYKNIISHLQKYDRHDWTLTKKRKYAQASFVDIERPTIKSGKAAH